MARQSETYRKPGDVEEHSRPPPSQRKPWNGLPKEEHVFFARILLPFFSTKYKTDTTINCILKALSLRVVPEDYDAVVENALPEELPSETLWRAPLMEHRFAFGSLLSLYHIDLHRAAPLLFSYLRTHIFHIEEADYQGCFTPESELEPLSNLGFSGSLFFSTADSSMLIKSINRRFEFEFLYERMIESYALHCIRFPDTVLCRITDILYCFDYRLGNILGFSPAHYLVMENSLLGLDERNGGKKWDLKPQSFFEPTRDLVPESVKTEHAKSGLADDLDEEIVMSKEQKTVLMRTLERDTLFLEEMRVIDYSLLLGRFPRDQQDGFEGSRAVESPDGKWVYRFCIVDFLWNVDMLQPKVMRTAGILLPEQTITTVPDRYRNEFLKMMDEYVLVK